MNERTDQISKAVVRPSVDLAYELALNAYDTAQKRLEVVEKRLQEILGFAATVSLGAVAVFANKGYHFKSWLFVGAMAAGLSGLILGTYARLQGYLVLIKPSVLHDKYLSLPEATFKSYFVAFAGKHWRLNADLINRKGRYTNLAVICFALEVILLVLWSVKGTS